MPLAINCSMVDPLYQIRKLLIYYEFLPLCFYMTIEFGFLLRITFIEPAQPKNSIPTKRSKLKGRLTMFYHHHSLDAVLRPTKDHPSQKHGRNHQAPVGSTDERCGSPMLNPKEPLCWKVRQYTRMKQVRVFLGILTFKEASR
jgi:hypothetical protein